MKIISNNLWKILELFGLPHTCSVKGCNNPIFAIVAFTPKETKGKQLNYPICRDHCIEGSKLGTVIWDFKE